VHEAVVAADQIAEGRRHEAVEVARHKAAKTRHSLSGAAQCSRAFAPTLRYTLLLRASCRPCRAHRLAP
jgi:hypothetical protein